MNLTIGLSCLLAVTLCLSGVESEEIEIVGENPKLSTQVSAEESPMDMEITKHNLRRAVELAVLKGIKFRMSKVRGSRFRKSRPRYWRPSKKRDSTFVFMIAPDYDDVEEDYPQETKSPDFYF